ncbi:MAG: mobilization protein [Rubrivivax sp.]
MSQIHFIGGEKGGVGKSLLARVLAQHFIDRQQPFVAFDTDRSHGALLRYYASYTSPLSLDDPTGLDRVIEAAADDPAQRVLVDLAAQSQASLTRWLDDAGVLAVAAEMGVVLNYWHVMDANRDSVDLLRRWQESPGAAMRLVLVLNEVRGEHFGQLGSSGLLEGAWAAGARTMRLRKLPDALIQKVDAGGASFWAAQQAGSSDLGLLDRQRMRLWLQRTQTDIEALQP